LTSDARPGEEYNRKYLLNHSDDEINKVATQAWQADEKVQRVNSIVLSPDDTPAEKPDKI